MPASFTISPAVDLIDVPRRIALADLPAGAKVGSVRGTARTVRSGACGCGAWGTSPGGGTMKSGSATVPA